MTNRRQFVLGAGASATFLWGFSRSSQSARPTVGIAYALNGKGDQSYNDAAARVLPELGRLFSINEFSPLVPTDYSRAIDILADQRPRFIFCIGYVYDNYVDELAPNYPNTVFCVLDGAPKRAKNAVGIQFRAEEASALAGIVAADSSKTRKLGFVGGTDIPVIRKFFDGFVSGAKRFDREISVESSFIGAGPEAFTNASRGKDVALQLIDDGADVLFHAAGHSGDGVIAAAQERGIWAVGVDVDQTHLAPKTVITNVIKRLDVAILSMARGEIRLNSGVRTPISLGIRERGVEISPPRHPLSKRASSLLTTLRDEFDAGP